MRRQMSFGRCLLRPQLVMRRLTFQTAIAAATLLIAITHAQADEIWTCAYQFAQTELIRFVVKGQAVISVTAS
jgi:hypothetical protein